MSLRCPECGRTDNLSTERKMDGDTHCNNCGHRARTSYFQVNAEDTARPVATTKKLEHLTHPLQRHKIRLGFATEGLESLEQYVYALEQFVSAYENGEGLDNDECEVKMFKAYTNVLAARKK